MLAPLAAVGMTQPVRDPGAAQAADLSLHAGNGQSLPSARLARPDDAAFLTVEPDGRDDVGFLDRLRHALRTVFKPAQQPDAVDGAVDRALAAASRPLDAAAEAGQDFFAQLRIVAVEVAFAEDGADGRSTYASYRRLGVEIGVARSDGAGGGVVRAEDVAVVGFDGRAIELSTEQRRTGLASGTYRQVEAGPSPALTGAAGERLEAARTGLARVKAMQDALGAYRSGNVDPLKRLLVDGEGPAAGRFGAVFPGIGALALN